MREGNDSPARYDLRHLRHLVAVNEHGTLQAAAEHLHLSQSALTKSLQKLEESLGAELFDRSGRRLLLTPLGRHVLTRAQRVLRVADDVQREADSFAAGAFGEVVLGVGPVVALGSLPQVLAAFCPRFPQVGVVVRSGSTESLVPRLLAGELHFVVADYEALEAHPELQVRALGADPIGVAARPGHPLCGTSTPALADVLHFPRGSATAPPRIRQWLRTQPGGDELRQSLTCDNYEVLVAVAEESDTLVLGPISMLRRYERAGRLAVLPIAYPSPPSEPAVLCVRDRPLAPAVVALMKEFGAGGA